MSHPHHEHRQHKVERERVKHITKGYAHGGAVHADEKADMKLIKHSVKKSALKAHGDKPKHRADKRARGGRTKKKGTTVNIINAPSHPQPGMPPMMPHPPMAPPPGPPPAMPPAAAPPMAPRPMAPPPGMPMRASGGRVKSGPTYKEGIKNGTQVEHMPGKLDGKDVGRRKPVTYKTGGAVKPRLVSFYAYGGKVESPKGVAPATKLPGGSGGGEGRLAKERRAERDYKRA